MKINRKYLQIETRNRFRSLRSKPVDIEEKKPEVKPTEQVVITDDKKSCIVESPKTLSLKEREIFHDTFSFLIKLVRKCCIANKNIFLLIINFKVVFLYFTGKYGT